jgi:F0F1-type ATP synthase membrane subunit c/vacuolar-type H+-ATPase subunit K
MSSPDPHVDPETRLRTMRILWAVFLTTIGLYAFVAYMARPSDESSAGAAESLGTGTAAGGLSVLIIVLFALGLSAVVASFLVKQAYAQRAVREQSPAVLQTGFIVAVVLCETAALFGMVGLFVDGNPLAYLLFVIAAAGIVLHFPRREDVIAASGGETGFGMGIN